MKPHPRPNEVALGSRANKTAYENWGLELTWGDMYELAEMVRKMETVVLYKVYDRKMPTHVHAAMWDGVVIPFEVTIDNTQGFMIQAVLPVDALLSKRVLDGAYERMMRLGWLLRDNQ